MTTLTLYIASTTHLRLGQLDGADQGSRSGDGGSVGADTTGHTRVGDKVEGGEGTRGPADAEGTHAHRSRDGGDGSNNSGVGPAGSGGGDRGGEGVDGSEGGKGAVALPGSPRFPNTTSLDYNQYVLSDSVLDLSSADTLHNGQL